MGKLSTFANILQAVQTSLAILSTGVQNFENLMPVKNAQLSLNELFVLVLSDGIITPEEHELLLNFSRGTVKTIDARLATRQDSPTRGELGLKERDSNPVPSSSPPKGAE